MILPEGCNTGAGPASLFGPSGRIGVLADEADHTVVREFFELFKTPWEFYRNDRSYDVVLCSTGNGPEPDARLVLVYGTDQRREDSGRGLAVSPPVAGGRLSYRAVSIPIYGDCVTFQGPGQPVLRHQTTQQPAAVETSREGKKRVRLGFSLFHEVRHLLTCGQPAAYAEIPSLEIHVAIVRDLIVGAAIPLVEIPPVPAGHSFMACLTHDVDHAGIRNHKFDHTMWGFLYRATIGSLINLFRGRRTFKQMASNWVAALSLPLVYLKQTGDFWIQFDRYLALEKGLTSTFFLVWNKDDPGQTADGRRVEKRAVRYDVAGLSAELRRVVEAGHEIGLHGIDAWRDGAKAGQEKSRLSGIVGTPVNGVRMHWLYFDSRSPAVLEAAGLCYDSTVGYNETVGYRAGTTQVFRPLGLQRLMELPMHIMDTALFYPSYRNLSPKAAESEVHAMIDNSVQYGGVLTVNWHDRSLAPERLWDTFYSELLDELKRRGAWFPTASQAVAWFKMRRSVTMETVSRDGLAGAVRLSAEHDRSLPSLVVRVHRAPPAGEKSVDIIFDKNMEVPPAAPASF